MKNKILIASTILMLAAKAALGADDTTNELYRANEFSVDMFGSASIGKYTINNLSRARVQANTRLGAGLGVNYFITRNLGLSADAYSESLASTFVDSASANLTLRLPLGQSGFAPYVYGGGGHQADPARFWFAQVGAGMEYRFCPNWAMFLDARWVIPEQTKYYGVARLGMRFAF